MTVYRREFRTNWLLWAGISLALFTLGGFVDPLPGIKGTHHFWGRLAMLLRGDYICSTGELATPIAFQGLVLLALPSAVLGWVAHALIVAVLDFASPRNAPPATTVPRHPASPPS
jgi:hypothetical protein